MKNYLRFKFRMTLLIINVILLSFGCSKDDNNTSNQKFVDDEGNEYPIAEMCDGKIWMLKNLNVTKFRNGDALAYHNYSEWQNEPDQGDAYCNYGDNEVNASVYGRLYNWSAVTDSRNLAPDRWHVASDNEWNNLILCYGGEDFAGDKLKEAGFDHWVDNTSATNEDGFTALPGSKRVYIPFQSDEELGYLGYWWTASTSLDCDIDEAIVRKIFGDQSGAYRGCLPRGWGLSVRCVRD